MSKLPDHFWTEDLYTTYMQDTAVYTWLKNRRWIKSTDYNTIWVYCQYKSRDGNAVWLYFHASDGVGGVQNSAVKSTPSTSYQNTGKLIIDVSGFTAGSCLLELMTKDNIKIRGIAALLKE